MKEAKKQIAEHASQDNELYALAERCEKVYQASAVEVAKIRFRGDDDPRNLLETTIAIFDSRDTPRTEIEWEIHDVFEPLQTELDSIARDFAHWIYCQLQAEADYLTSDECVDEAARQYTFDEEGETV